MESPCSFTARQYDQTSLSGLETPCSTYIPTPSRSNNCHTMPRHTSLPSMKLAMFSTDFALSNGMQRERAEYTNSLRRSVSGMKTLLPLKLSSSQPTSTWSSLSAPHRSTFGFEGHSAEQSQYRASHQSPSRRFNIPRPVTIRREHYRDTPVYTEPGSPLLNLAYYTEEQNLESPILESCDENSIFGEYALSSVANEDFEGLDEDVPIAEGSLPAEANRLSRSSDLSFKCLGEARRSRFFHESARLSSRLNFESAAGEDAFPQDLANNMHVDHDIEGWLSLSETSSICDEADEDSYVSVGIPVGELD